MVHRGGFHTQWLPRSTHLWQSAPESREPKARTPLMFFHLTAPRSFSEKKAENREDRKPRSQDRDLPDQRPGLRRVEKPPAAVVVLAPVIGLLLWIAFFWLLFW